MKTTNFCRRISVADKIQLERYAKRLGAEEMVIHKDGTVTLTCTDGYICERERIKY